MTQQGTAHTTGRETVSAGGVTACAHLLVGSAAEAVHAYDLLYGKPHGVLCHALSTAEAWPKFLG
jgi:hypothetical protein